MNRRISQRRRLEKSKIPKKAVNKTSTKEEAFLMRTDEIYLLRKSIRELKGNQKEKTFKRIEYITKKLGNFFWSTKHQDFAL